MTKWWWLLSHERMASIYRRGQVWWIKFTDHIGRVRRESLHTSNKKAAERARNLVERRLAEKVAERQVSASTLRGYAEEWRERRRNLGVQDCDNEWSRLSNHLFDRFGDRGLDEIAPSDLARWAEDMRATDMAPKTLHNVYGALRALYRQAMIDGVVAGTPCVLNQVTLGKSRDKDPEWRPSAIFTATEVTTLLDCELIAPDRRLCIAFAALAGLRMGEVAGLKWSDIERREPLSRLLVARSYDKPGGKTGRAREVPIHPRLAAMIARWRFAWPEEYERQPVVDDLILPTTGDSARTKPGQMRNKKYMGRRFGEDLKAVELRHRRFHDLRRTFISVALEGGANGAVLKTITHAPETSSAFELYHSFTWAAKCKAVSALTLTKAHETERGADQQ